MTRFDKWVNEMYNEYTELSRYEFWCIRPWYTFCIDIRTNNVTMARRHPNDKFNPRIGEAIAYARMKGYEIPKQAPCKTLDEMKNGDRFYYNGTIYQYIGAYHYDNTDKDQIVHVLCNEDVFVDDNLPFSEMHAFEMWNDDSEYEMIV